MHNLHREILTISGRAIIACVVLGLGAAVLALDYVQAADLSVIGRFGIGAIALVLTSGMAISMYMIYRLASVLIRNARGR